MSSLIIFESLVVALFPVLILIFLNFVPGLIIKSLMLSLVICCLRIYFHSLFQKKKSLLLTFAAVLFISTILYFFTEENIFYSIFNFAAGYFLIEIVLLLLYLANPSIKNRMGSIFTFLLFVIIISMFNRYGDNIPVLKNYFKQIILFEIFFLVIVSLFFVFRIIKRTRQNQKLSENKKNQKKNIIKDLDKANSVDFKDLAGIWTNTENQETDRKDVPLLDLIIPEEKESHQKTHKILKMPEKTKNNMDKIELEENDNLLESEKEKTIYFKNTYVQQIYDEYIKPYLSQEDTKIACCLLSLLDEDPDTPSISNKEKEKNIPDSLISNTFDILEKITLAEHTYNVVGQIMLAVKEKYPDTWHITFPNAVLVAIAHDLGKSSVLVNKKGPLYYGEHSDISAQLFEDCAMGMDKKRRDVLALVIVNHHGRTSEDLQDNELLALLKSADKKAREIEYKKIMKNVHTWRAITAELFGEKLIKNILEITERPNKESLKNCVYTISIKKNMLYVYPVLFIKTLSDIVKENNIFWPELIGDDTDKLNAIINFFKEVLEPAGWLPAGEINLKRNFYFKKYPLEVNGRKRSGQYIPILLKSVCKSAEYDFTDLIKKFEESPFRQIVVLQ